MTKRRCKSCNREKRTGLFSYRKWTCNACYRKTDSYRRDRSRHLEKTYGITFDEYELMLDASHGECWICGGGSTVSLAVDHDHDTRQIRGLLCKRCNSTLAKIHNRLDIANAMVAYLAEPGAIVNVLLGREALTPDTSREE